MKNDHYILFRNNTQQGCDKLSCSACKLCGNRSDEDKVDDAVHYTVQLYAAETDQYLFYFAANDNNVK